MYLLPIPLDPATSPFSAPVLVRALPLSAFSDDLSILKGDSQLQRWSSLIGIVTAIVGNILISFALNIQRYAHIKLHEERTLRKEKARSALKSAGNGYGTTNTSTGQASNGNGYDNAEATDPMRDSFHSTESQSSGRSSHGHDHESTYLKSPYWWGGIILMTVGEVGNFLAYGFAPASIVSPLGVVSLISNCVIAPVMLKEHFRVRDFWGVVVAVAGAVTVVLSAKQKEKKLGPHEIWEAITTIEFEVYMVATIFCIGLLMWASPRYGTRTILVDLGLVGLFGGYTALSTKGVASMLSSTLWRAFTTPVTYALLVVLVGTAIMQVKYVNKALQRFDSTQVIPVQFVMFTLSVIMGSAILYRDFEKVTADNVGKFIGGCLLTFFGVFLITNGRPQRAPEAEDDSDEEGEESISLARHDSRGAESEHRDHTSSSRKRSHTGPLQNGESVSGAVKDSRRSSHVSFADSPSQPETPRKVSVSSYQPSIRVVPSSSLTEPFLGTEETPLLENPRKDTTDGHLQAARHPGMHNTTSSPALPSEAQTNSLDPLRLPNARTSSQGNVHTHANQQQGPTPPQADVPYTPARNSISRMMPGPLLSPLSGGLSVIVADSLRRGVDLPSRSKSVRSSQLGIRRTRSGSQKSVQQRSDETDPETSVNKDDTAESRISKSQPSGGGEWSSITRARSLSNTLGDLFRSKRHNSDISHSLGDEEAGPSGT